jgi:hypothetical protein
MYTRKAYATREAPRRGQSDDQLEAREGQAGRFGVAEGFVVPLKLGNAGGGKGPQFKTDAIRGEEPGDWATYQLRIVFQKLQMALHATAKAWGLVREPDAGDLHVRFDERGVETESRLNQ